MAALVVSTIGPMPPWADTLAANIIPQVVDRDAGY